MFWPPALRNFGIFCLFWQPEDTIFTIASCSGHQVIEILRFFYMFWPQEDAIFIGVACSGHQNFALLQFLSVLATKQPEFHIFLFWPSELRTFEMFYVLWAPVLR